MYQQRIAYLGVLAGAVVFRHRIARQPNVKVDPCFLCHQATSWNDIKGVGKVTHH
ncbi:hypothetical protein RA8P2_00183 (plasmid) [Variovorax sp. RA8]|nr:hypothetical protein RA8P2_00183 [Variovorax sp. RA8]